MRDLGAGNREKRIRELFLQALDLPKNQRGSFLEETCTGDPNLRTEVETLLLEEASGCDILEKLANEIVWPALESLRSDQNKLSSWIQESTAGRSWATSKDLLVGKSVSHFEILGSIGHGGMGMVYKARDITLDRIVALKFLPLGLSSDQAAKERFVLEAKAASALDHPNVATVHEIGETEGGQVFICMGYYPGESLKAKIDRGPLSQDQVLKYAIQLASALEQVHQLGIIHRDIKPGNIQITQDDEVKLLDFGLAKLSDASGYTRSDQMIGTVAYMSPEQAKGIQVDHLTDIWSLGVVIYEMLTGRLPFTGENAQSAIHAILFKDPNHPTELNIKAAEHLMEILGRCLAKNPENRYQSADELMRDLKRVQDGSPISKHGGDATWGRWSRKWRLAGGAVLVVALALTALLWREFGELNSPRKVGERVQDQNILNADAYAFTKITEGDIVEKKGFFTTSEWGDYDNDGWLDILIIEESESGGFLNLYHNDGNGTFSRSLYDQDADGAFAGYWADQDNDGDLDLYVTTRLDRTTGQKAANLFFRNDGRGGFIREAEGDWLTTSVRSQGAAWGDFDNDGWVDLYVANAASPNPETGLLFRNLGNGTMVSVEAEVTRYPGTAHACLWSDYDNDGDVDLFIGGQGTVLFRNEGGGHFLGIPSQSGGISEFTQDVDIGFASADYDNDGDLDLSYIVWGLGVGVRMYRNNGGRAFTDVTYLLGAEGFTRGMGAHWGDYDNDGFQDLFVPNYSGKNLLFHNEGDGSFVAIKDHPIIEGELPACGAGWCDIDNDGDLDLFVTNGAGSKVGEACELFRNEGGLNHWIELDLVGTASNKSAIGAKVWAIARINGRTLTQLRESQSGGCTQSACGLRVHFGLGDADEIDTLLIEWPSGIVQEMQNIDADQILTVIEEEATRS